MRLPKFFQRMAALNPYSGSVTFNPYVATMRTDYENLFAYVNKVVTEILSHEVYAVDKQGRRAGFNLIDKLRFPNGFESSDDFLSKTLSAFLTNPEVDILVTHYEMVDGQAVEVLGAGSGITPDNVARIIALPKDCSAYVVDGHRMYSFPWFDSTATVDERSVMQLRYAISTDDMDTGVSPGSASHVMSSLQDQTNLYELAFFKNGATPSGQYDIYAPTREQADSIRMSIERDQRGASNSHGVIYNLHIQSNVTGLQGAHAEYTQLGVNNTDLALTDLRQMTDRGIGRNMAVPDIMLGDASTTTYQNQQTARKAFNDVLNNVARRYLSSLQFQWSRVTGCYYPQTLTIDSFDSENTDELKVEADTLAVRAGVFEKLINLGVDSNRAAVAAGLEEWRGLGANKSEKSAVESITADTAMANAAVSVEHPSLQRQIQDVFTRLSDSDRSDDAQAIRDLQSLMARLCAHAGKQVAVQLAEQVKSLNLRSDWEQDSESLLAIETAAHLTVESFRNDDKSDAEMGAAIIAAALFAGKQGSHIGQRSASKYTQAQLDAMPPKPVMYHVVGTWHCNGVNPCEFCLAMEGKEVSDENLPATITAKNGDVLVTNPQYIEAISAHPHCQCTETYKLVRV